MKPKILVVDDHQLFRACLKLALEKAGFDVVGEAGDARSAMRSIIKLQPQAVTIDLSMPGWNGIEFIRQTHRDFPLLKVLVVSMHSETHFIMESLASGAAGYLLKDSSARELADALRAILCGHKYIGPEIVDLVIGRAVAQWLSENDPRTAKISSREREVLQLVAEGKSTREIAASLYVSIKTVETHRRQLMGRLHLVNIAQLTKFAVREGITSLH